MEKKPIQFYLEEDERKKLELLRSSYGLRSWVEVIRKLLKEAKK